MRLIPATTLTLALTAVLTACVTTGGGGVKSTRTVVIDGKTVLVEDAAKERYDRAISKKKAGETNAAEAELREVLRLYPDATWADYATVALAQIYVDTDRAPEGQKVLEDFLLERPKSEAADQARYTLAMAQLAQGDTKSAAPTLESLVDRMPSKAEKRGAALKLAEELFKGGQSGEAARYLGRAHALTDDEAERAELEARLEALIDGEVGFTDLRRLKELEAEKGTYFDELITFKLARVFVHLRDEPRAAEYTAEYLERYPTGRYAPAARELNNALQSRVKVEPDKIGVVLPLSGQFKPYGERVLTAIRLGMDLPADKNAAKGKPTLIVKDSAGDPQKASAAMKALVEEDHVIGIIGELLVDSSLPVALSAEDYGVPTLSLSRREGLTELGKWSFRVAFTPTKQAQALARVAMDGLGMQRFAILYPKHSYGQEFMQAFWDEVDKRKGEVTGVEAYAHDQTTFTSEVKSLVGRYDVGSRSDFLACRREANAIEDQYKRKKANERCRDDVKPIVDFEALVIPDDYRTVSYIIPALEAEDILITQDRYRIEQYRKATDNTRLQPVRVLLGSLGDMNILEERLQPRQADGTLIVQGYHQDAQTEKNKAFIESFAKVHRSPPSMLDSHARDAGALLGALLAGVTVPKPKSREELRALLQAVQDFPGVTGLIRFDENGDSATTPTFFKLEKGKMEVADKRDLERQGEG